MLVPTDGSKLSQKAVLKAMTLAKALAAPPATPTIYRHNLPVGYAQPEEHQKLIDEATALTLGFVEKTCKDAGVAFAAIHAMNDIPEDEILKAVERQVSELIVMGTHGHSGQRGALIGSVAHKVLNKATVPVMVVR